MGSTITDEARWRSEGRPETMTLEQRADFIASAGRNRPGSPTWKLLRDRALAQLREVAP